MLVITFKLQRRGFAELIMEQREEQQGLLLGTGGILNDSGGMITGG